ncbi:hypothetical protein ACFY4C_16985 [Actinomadura viridis]|uniref:hypothetical protein n=1 Tax=Actinomadura viridis TaxID=58110 RepID=UPI00368307A2
MVILLVALVAAALVTSSMGALVVGGIKNAICKVVKADGDCEMPQDRDRAYLPTCLLYVGFNHYGGSGEALVFRVGRDYRFLQFTYLQPDGNKVVTLYALKGVTGGLGTGVGAGLNWGRTVNLGVDAIAEAKVRLGVGDGWQFIGRDADEQAARFKEQLEEQMAIDAVKENAGPLGYIGGKAYEFFAGPDLPEPHIRRYEGELDLYAGVWGMGSIGAGGNEGNKRDGRGSDWLSPNVNAWAAINGNEKAALILNDRTGDSSLLVMTRGEFNYGANAGVNGPQGRVQADGWLFLTRNKDGVLTSASFTQTHVVNGKATMVNTDLPLRTDADRATLVNYLFHPTEGGLTNRTLALTYNDMAPSTDPGPDGTPLQRLLYEKGQTSKVDYDHHQVDSLYGAGVKLGLKLGASFTITDQSRSATGKATYLGAPRPDGTRPYLPQPECRR